MTWQSDDLPPSNRVSGLDWVRVGRRGLAVGTLVFGGLAVLLLVRLIERPFHGQARPVTPYITQAVCRAALVLLGIGFRRVGAPMTGAGAVVANHSSWLDIFALNASKRIYFVSKAEVANWPGIGWLARATGTVFIARNRSEAAAQVAVFRERLGHGHRLLFFPEGTSTDGLRVLPFKPTLFAAFFDDALRDDLRMQAVSVIYDAPANADPRLYGWWGDMAFGPHLLTTLARRRQGSVTVVYHPPVHVSAFAGRKALAAEMERQVRAGHPAAAISPSRR